MNLVNSYINSKKKINFLNIRDIPCHQGFVNANGIGILQSIEVDSDVHLPSRVFLEGSFNFNPNTISSESLGRIIGMEITQANDLEPMGTRQYQMNSAYLGRECEITFENGTVIRATNFQIRELE